MARSSVFVIAEAGVNHNGDVQTAKLLIDAAKFCGADAVKFQMFSSQKLWGDDRIAHLELKPEDYEALADHCQEACIEFMCTPFGVAELEFLAPILKRVKIASGCIARHALLEAARATQLPVLISTGMSTYDDIRHAVNIVGATQTTLLHCTSVYPCPLAEVNLRAMQAMGYFGCPVGYSDHTEGVVTSLAAAAMGASVIEKHLTLDRTQDGPDHKASIEPKSFRTMVESIRQIEVLLGERSKSVQPSEQETWTAWRSTDKAYLQ